MRPSNKSRSRNKSGNNPNRRNVGNIVNRVFESAGPDGKVRGTPQQIIDKYQALGRDAQVSGDRVAAENYLQHSEHYTRLLGDALRQMQDEREERGEDGRERGEGGGDRFPPHQHQPQQHQPRHDQPRHDQPPQHQPRLRDEAPRREEPVARQEPPARPEPSGLATFDADDGTEQGPVETPEESGRRREERPAAAEAPVANGTGHAASDTAGDGPGEAPAPAKRPRTRRKAKAVIEAAEAGAE
jgi:hypothetical protein